MQIKLKEAAASKKLKISEAQQYTILSVLGASILLGISIALVLHFIQLISFNTKVIMAEEASIANYSKVIKNTGICKAPKGDIYSNEELDACNPDNIEVTEIEGTLRANILQNLAANEALNSVPKENSSDCLNSDGKNFTYKELMSNYEKATSTEELVAASQAIKRCSALRVIPDALPSYRNSEALLASLNKIFTVSDWEPEFISPGGNSSDFSSDPNVEAGLNPIVVNLSVEANTGTTMRVLKNIERSIREFNIGKASFEWSGNDSLLLQAQAAAYYVNKSSITESSQSITANSTISTKSGESK